MRGLAALIRFMTRIPVPGNSNYDPDELGKSMKYFPIVGMIIGVLLFGLYFFSSFIIASAWIIATLLVLFEVMLTGGIHLDGLADTFDGIFSYRSRQKMLEIMKDPRIGSNGAMALIFYFLFKVILLVEIFSNDGIEMGVVLLIAPVIARLNAVVNCAVAPYARVNGMGKAFVEHTNSGGLVISTLIVTLYVFFVSNFFLGDIRMLILIPILMLLGTYFAKVMQRKIGGVTGDTLGAVLEMSEIITLLGIYILYLF